VTSSKIFGSILRAGGVLVAPWMYTVGRLARSRRLVSAALSADPLYVRVVVDRFHIEGRKTFTLLQFLSAVKLIASAGDGADVIVKQAFPGCQAQLLQDIACLLVHSAKRGGYFVEVGVGDGVTISNTYLLEKHYGWEGLLVEPSRGFHDHIRVHRCARLDTRCAAGTNDGIVEFEEILGDGEFSRKSGLGNRSFDEDATVRYPVETTTLDRLLEEHDAPRKIDFISVDTEGGRLGS